MVKNFLFLSLALRNKHLNSVSIEAQCAGAQRRSSKHTIVQILFALCDHEQGVRANNVKTESAGYWLLVAKGLFALQVSITM